MKSKLVFAVFLSVCLLQGCSKKENSGKDAAVKNVKTVSPILIGDVTTRTLPGVVKVASEINLGFKTAGQINRIYVKEGDYVREGDKIAELDKSDYKLQLEASEIQYNQLKTEVERMEELFKRNSISENDYDKAKAGLRALGIQLQANKNTIENTTLKSPVSGYIQTINFAKSEMVNAGTPVVALVDVSTVKVESELPASLFLRFNDFIGYSCRSNLIPEETISLKLTGINRKSNSSQLHKINFVPENAKSALAPGMNVEVMISIRENTSGTKYTLPFEAIFKENNKTYVWIVQNNIVKKQEVRTGGIDPDGNLIILSGISENDKVVKAGIRALNENDQVRIIPAKSKTNVGGIL